MGRKPLNPNFRKDAHLHIRCEKELKKRFMEYCEENKIDASDMIRKMLREFLII